MATVFRSFSRVLVIGQKRSNSPMDVVLYCRAASMFRHCFSVILAKSPWTILNVVLYCRAANSSSPKGYGAPSRSAAGSSCLRRRFAGAPEESERMAPSRQSAAICVRTASSSACRGSSPRRCPRPTSPTCPSRPGRWTDRCPASSRCHREGEAGTCSG